MARALAAPLLAALLSVTSLFAAAQQAVPPEDARAVRAVVEAQIEAFRRDDAAQAFSLATPGIRERFGDADTFLEMVKVAYAVVYRPQSVNFEAPQVIDGELVQPVHLTDAQGRAWIAIYPMQRQPDGSWRTNGCQLVRFAGIET